MTNVALIPARKNSKGVPGKNKRLLSGLPLVAHSIDFAVRSSVIDKVVLNTDDENISEYCSENYDAVEIYMRSQSLAQDDTGMADVLVDYIKTTSCQADFIILLQPTSPIRHHDDLSEMLTLISSDPSVHCVTSVSEIPQHLSPHLMFSMKETKLTTLMGEMPTRRQNVPKSYIRDGQIYVIRVSSLLQHKAIITSETHGFVSSESGINIDTEEDWNRAVGLYKDI
jgi:CMP-N,N'-diacetyllegionaminic acid synthase